MLGKLYIDVLVRAILAKPNGPTACLSIFVKALVSPRCHLNIHISLLQTLALAPPCGGRPCLHSCSFTQESFSHLKILSDAQMSCAFLSRPSSEAKITSVWPNESPKLASFTVFLMAASLQEPFQGVDFSASGLRQVALQFETDASQLNISELISAPNLEHLELEFPSIANLDEPDLQVAPGRHNKPFMLIVVSSIIPETSPSTLPLEWRTLERGFGLQDYTDWRNMGVAALHQPLLRESDRKHRRIYCNLAYTAAARAQTLRLALSQQTCDFKLFREDWLCWKCEELDWRRANGCYVRRRRTTFCRVCFSDDYCDCPTGDSEDESY